MKKEVIFEPVEQINSHGRILKSGSFQYLKDQDGEIWAWWHEAVLNQWRLTPLGAKEHKE